MGSAGLVVGQMSKSESWQLGSAQSVLSNLAICSDCEDTPGDF